MESETAAGDVSHFSCSAHARLTRTATPGRHTRTRYLTCQSEQALTGEFPVQVSGRRPSPGGDSEVLHEPAESFKCGRTRTGKVEAFLLLLTDCHLFFSPFSSFSYLRVWLRLLGGHPERNYRGSSGSSGWILRLSEEETVLQQPAG